MIIGSYSFRSASHLPLEGSLASVTAHVFAEGFATGEAGVAPLFQAFEFHLRRVGPFVRERLSA
jgi:hypothetical protein